MNTKGGVMARLDEDTIQQAIANDIMAMRRIAKKHNAYVVLDVKTGMVDFRCPHATAVKLAQDVADYMSKTNHPEIVGNIFTERC